MRYLILIFTASILSGCGGGFEATTVGGQSALSSSAVSLCTPGSSQTCQTGNGTGTRTCNTAGSAYGSCGGLTSCDPGFNLQAGVCVADICAPGSSQTCQTGNGTGTRTCNSTGAAYGSCGGLTSCDPGFNLQAGVCVADICAPGSSQTCQTGNGTGSRMCNSAGSAYGSCGGLTSCDPGFNLQAGVCVADVCAPNSVRACSIAGGSFEGFGMQTCSSSGASWGTCGNPGQLTSQNAVDNYVEVRSQPNQYFYNYAPDVIFFNGNYHMYWCAGVGASGDYILHAQSANSYGPFHSASSAAAFSYDVALKPTLNTNNFDGTETCDPSVLQVGSTFYLYYGGLATDSNSTSVGKVGVATSSDGISFARANGGTAIVSPINWTPGAYGAGQPAVFYIAPYYYLSFTDTTGPGGSGQYMIRALDPLFQTGVEELVGPAVWTARSPDSRSGQYMYLNAYSVDIAYDPMTKNLFIASDQIEGQNWIYILNPATFANLNSTKTSGLSGRAFLS